MDNNEEIARWRGWVKTGSPIPWLTPKSDRFMSVPPYDSGIGFWHGERGLLAEIERKGIKNKTMASNKLLALFGGYVLDIVFRDRNEPPVIAREEVDLTAGFVLLATPAQLSEALVKVIKGGGMKKRT